MTGIIKTLLKLTAAAGVVAAGAAAAGALAARKKEENERLDEYLMESGEEAVSPAAPDEQYLEQDFEEWNSLDQDGSVEVSFLVEGAQAETFQKDLAEQGISSHYDPKSQILDCVINGPQTREELAAIRALFEKLMKDSKSTYLGFAFE